METGGKASSTGGKGGRREKACQEGKGVTRRAADLLFDGPRLFPPAATPDGGACITFRLVNRLPAQMHTLKSVAATQIPTHNSMVLP